MEFEASSKHKVKQKSSKAASAAGEARFDLWPDSAEAVKQEPQADAKGAAVAAAASAQVVCYARDCIPD